MITEPTPLELVDFEIAGTLKRIDKLELKIKALNNLKALLPTLEDHLETIARAFYEICPDHDATLYLGVRLDGTITFFFLPAAGVQFDMVTNTGISLSTDGQDYDFDIIFVHLLALFSY